MPMREELDLFDPVAITTDTVVYVQPAVTFVYPPEGPMSEATPIADVPPILRSALAAEQQAERFADAGGRGVVLRFAVRDGPGTGNDEPIRDFGATLHVHNAIGAHLSALTPPPRHVQRPPRPRACSTTASSETVGCHPAF